MIYRQLHDYQVPKGNSDSGDSHSRDSCSSNLRHVTE